MAITKFLLHSPLQHLILRQSSCGKQQLRKYNKDRECFQQTCVVMNKLLREKDNIILEGMCWNKDNTENFSSLLVWRKLKHELGSVTFAFSVSEGITQKSHPLRKQQQKIQQRKMHTGIPGESLSRGFLLVLASDVVTAWGQSCSPRSTKSAPVQPGWGMQQGKASVAF